MSSTNFIIEKSINNVIEKSATEKNEEKFLDVDLYEKSTFNDVCIKCKDDDIWYSSRQFIRTRSKFFIALFTGDEICTCINELEYTADEVFIILQRIDLPNKIITLDYVKDIKALFNTYKLSLKWGLDNIRNDISDIIAGYKDIISTGDAIPLLFHQLNDKNFDKVLCTYMKNISVSKDNTIQKLVSIKAINACTTVNSTAPKRVHNM